MSTNLLTDPPPPSPLGWLVFFSCVLSCPLFFFMWNCATLSFASFPSSPLFLFSCLIRDLVFPVLPFVNTFLTFWCIYRICSLLLIWNCIVNTTWGALLYRLQLQALLSPRSPDFGHYHWKGPLQKLSILLSRLRLHVYIPVVEFMRYMVYATPTPLTMQLNRKLTWRISAHTCGAVNCPFWMAILNISPPKNNYCTKIRAEIVLLLRNSKTYP